MFSEHYWVQEIAFERSVNDVKFGVARSNDSKKPGCGYEYTNESSYCQAPYAHTNAHAAGGETCAQRCEDVKGKMKGWKNLNDYFLQRELAEAIGRACDALEVPRRPNGKRARVYSFNVNDVPTRQRRDFLPPHSLEGAALGRALGALFGVTLAGASESKEGGVMSKSGSSASDMEEDEVYGELGQDDGRLAHRLRLCRGFAMVEDRNTENRDKIDSVYKLLEKNLTTSQIHQTLVTLGGGEKDAAVSELMRQMLKEQLPFLPKLPNQNNKSGSGIALSKQVDFNAFSELLQNRDGL